MRIGRYLIFLHVVQSPQISPNHLVQELPYLGSQIDVSGVAAHQFFFDFWNNFYALSSLACLERRHVHQPDRVIQCVHIDRLQNHVADCGKLRQGPFEQKMFNAVLTETREEWKNWCKQLNQARWTVNEHQINQTRWTVNEIDYMVPVCCLNVLSLER